MNGENNPAKAYNIRRLTNQDIVRLVKHTRLDVAASYGIHARRSHTNQKATMAPVDPRNNFRRKLIARCLTILRERGITDDLRSEC